MPMDTDEVATDLDYPGMFDWDWPDDFLIQHPVQMNRAIVGVDVTPAFNTSKPQERKDRETRSKVMLTSFRSH
jgi:hypothetical protein